MTNFLRFIAAIPLVLASICARAQMLPPDDALLPFSRYVAVRDRMIMGFDAPGVRVGSFRLQPSMDVTGNYNDNAFALASPRVGAGYIAISPSATLQSNWSNRSLTLGTSGEIDRFFTHTSENTESVNASAYGTQDLGTNTRVRLITRYQQARESRESQNSVALTERPIRYEAETGAFGLSHRFSSVLVSGQAGVTRSNYFDGRLQRDGSLVSQQYRNSDNFELRLRTEVAQSQALSYFAQVTRDATSFSRDSVSDVLRESKGYEILGGVRFELPVLARGEIGIGYQNSSFRDTKFRTFSGLAINSSVMFFPSQLTTITVNARRNVNNEAALRASSSYTALSGGVRVDHELLRTLILGAGIDLEGDTFNGLNRSDQRIAVNATADWRFTPRLSLRTAYDRLDLTSNGVDLYKSFARNRFTIGIGVRL